MYAHIHTCLGPILGGLQPRLPRPTKHKHSGGGAKKIISISIYSSSTLPAGSRSTSRQSFILTRCKLAISNFENWDRHFCRFIIFSNATRLRLTELVLSCCYYKSM